MVNLKKPTTKVRAGEAWVEVGDNTKAVLVKLWKADGVCFNNSVFHGEVDKKLEPNPFPNHSPFSYLPQARFSPLRIAY
ncbi:hypothetical protein V6N13_004490 [Hibiscus sabdariffa]